jgi:hypothetical protein
MIKKIFLVICLVTIGFLLTIAVTSCTADKINPSLGQKFTLPVGKTAVIAGESLSITFVEVTADSRCPTGVQCVWVGEAKCRASITYKGSESEIILTQSGGSTGMQGLFQIYNVSFKLEPYPEYGKQIASSDYKLVMTIIK